MKKILKNTKGITLVALVITIIILLILAGISISALTNTGIFQKAKDAKQKSENAALDQNTKLDEYENEIDKYIPKANSLAKAVKVGDYVAYTPDKLDKSALDKLKENLNTYSGARNLKTYSAIGRDNLSLRVIDGDEKTGAVRLISATPTSNNTTNSAIGRDNLSLRVIDGDEKTGAVRLISATPTSNNTTNSAIGRDNLGWRVLDVDEKTGAVRLISATPTDKTIVLYGYDGYNNAVKLLDDVCSTLYNSKLATKVQNLKIEDIQDKMKEKDYSKLYSEYGKTPIQPENKKYPSILAQEKNQKVNEYEGTLDLSKQDNYINQTDVLEANSLELKITLWGKIGETGPKVLTADDFEGDDGKIYSDMFCKDYTYWMSSRCIYADSDRAGFIVRCVSSGGVFANILYYSSGREDSGGFAFRPVITLNSNVQVTSGDGSESTPFEIK